MNKLIVAGDIGGTKTLLQLLETDGAQWRSLYQQRYNSADYADFNTLFADFIRDAQALIKNQTIKSVCFGIAGPINHRTAQVTNLLWLIDADALQNQFNIARVELINDFAATGYGIDMLHQHDFHVLQTGNAVETGTQVVIGAGTGLGEGYLVWVKDQYVPFPSEGGHVDFAPANEVQIDLLRHLQGRFGHVSYERVVSGMGLVNIFDFLAGNRQPSAALRHELSIGTDSAATIAEFALQKKDAVAEQALDIFVECYGAQAGNLALTCLARGGVYIAGGIAPKMIQRLSQGDFMRAFCDKGRFKSLMEGLPVKIVLNSDVGLQGAIRVAMQGC